MHRHQNFGQVCDEGTSQRLTQALLRLQHLPGQAVVESGDEGIGVLVGQNDDLIF